MTTIKVNDSPCRRMMQPHYYICIHSSGVITGAYCGVLKIGDDVVVVVHDESSFSCSGDAEFHGF